MRADFKGLPKGTGSVRAGEQVWIAKCASCHGDFAEANHTFPPIVGGTTAEDIRRGQQINVQYMAVEELVIQQQLAQLALSEMQKQADQSPLDARFPLFEGVMLESFGQPDAAAQALQKAHELSPNKQTILFELGTNALSRKDTAAALGYFKQAYDLAPQFLAARLYYAVAAIQAKDDALADDLLSPVIPTGEAADSKVAGAYADRGLYQKIVTIWEARIAAQPSDVQAYFTLSAAYYAMHDTQHAIATLQKAEEVNPAAKKQADSLIEQLQSGTLKLK